MNLFISHCSSDNNLLKDYIDVFVANKKDKIFFSSSAETGVEAGGEIMKTLNKKIKECDVFVCIVTENYLRSAFCMYELNIATYLFNKKRTIIPIVVNEATYHRIETTIKHLDLLYLDASNDEFNYRFSSIFPGANKARIEQFREQLFLANLSSRSYIGMEDSFYRNVIAYCEKHHIKTINNAFEDNNSLVTRVKNAKEITILSTTGSAIIKKLATEAFIVALVNGAKIRVIVPNQYSNFLYNVAQLERPDSPEVRFEELNHEFEAAMGYLIEAYQKAKKIKEDIGTIEYYCSYNMLRQTIIMVKSESDVFVSMSLTIPPKKTIDGTPTIVIDSLNEEKVLADILEQHCLAIMGVSKRNGDYLLIDEHTKAHPFFLEKESAKLYWQKKYDEAQNRMSNQRMGSKDILIEVAAQHPLEKDGSPRPEYQARLDEGIEQYKKLKKDGTSVKFYIPGSVHQFNGRLDSCSLSTAGRNYLVKHGVKTEDIYADEMNEKYKGEDGVYNSADECYVASKIFFDENFARLMCICSPNQLIRKMLFYVEFGVIPECYSVPSTEMYHDFLTEIFVNLPYVIYRDHDGQDKESELFITSRDARKPR